MHNNRPGFRKSNDGSETFQQIVDGFARLVFGLGSAVALICAGFLVYYFMTFSGDAAIEKAKPALELTGTLGSVLLAACIAVGIAVNVLFWVEEVCAVLQIIAAALLYFAPTIVGLLGGGSPSGIAGNPKTLEVAAAAGTHLQKAGIALGVIGVLSLGYKVVDGVRDRIRYGARAEAMKYGRGVKAEDIQNVFMGKCWQLPFCRKFVRERCPIYHSQRTCWKERVGCMCEEKVIQTAMQGGVIPKDAVVAARMIPYNKQLTQAQKVERCRSCVIYNEHQKHKYKLALPVSLAGVVGGYLLFRPALLDILGNALAGTDNVIRRITLGGSSPIAAQADSMLWLKEILLFCFMLVLLAYVLKIVEYLFFQAKI
jgi:hypothetical protein